MRERLEAAGRRFARLATTAVVARPVLWRLFRRPLRAQFERLAPTWEGRRTPDSLAPLLAGFERLPEPPRRVLDLGTGTGLAARAAAEAFPRAEIVGVDLAPAMLGEAARLLPEELAGRVRFEVADASALPYAAGEYDLVVLLNMIPFFAELARITAPGGHVLFGFSSGPQTPIYVPPELLAKRLGAVGFERFEELAAGEGTGFLAARSERG